uniref:Uncharacterized protein n=1 Tax=Chlamydomonas leiostraca TaxID=1034604 RepID=A0A7S0RKU4_9CHLO
MLKYGFGGALPCADAQRQHMQRAAGMAAVLTTEEEAEIGERFAQREGAPDRERFGSEGPPPLPREREGPPPPRERDWERDRDRDFRGPPPAPGPRDDGPPRSLPDLLEQLAMELPPPMALEGPPVPVDAVMDVVMFADLSPAAIAYGCAELDAGRPPSSANGVEVPQVLEAAARGGRPYEGYDQGGLPSPSGYGPPGPGGPGPLRREPPPPHDPYWHEPDPWMGPDGPPGPRKRRWEGDRDGYGPPPGDPNWGPPPDGRGPPPPWGYDDRRPPPGR